MIKRVLKKAKKSIKKIICTIKYQKYHTYCKKKDQKEIIIFNTPIHGNIGDHAILYAEKELFVAQNEKIFEVSTFEEEYYFPCIEKKISEKSEIYITGGGFIGSQWIEEQHLVNKVIKNFADYHITILPQTFYFKSDERGKKELEVSEKIFNSAKYLTICAREEKTYAFIQEHYPKARCILTPDIVLSLPKYEKNYEREGVLLCLREDPEGTLNQKDKEKIIEIAKKETNIVKMTDTVIQRKIKPQQREKMVLAKLEEFSHAKLIVTDRLHGMIFAYLTNTPCIVLGNYNHKVEGVYQWIKEAEYIFFEKEIEKIEEDIKQMYEKIYQYPDIDFLPKFKKIRSKE